MVDVPEFLAQICKLPCFYDINSINQFDTTRFQNGWNLTDFSVSVGVFLYQVAIFYKSFTVQ